MMTTHLSCQVQSWVVSDSDDISSSAFLMFCFSDMGKVLLLVSQCIFFSYLVYWSNISLPVQLVMLSSRYRMYFNSFQLLTLILLLISSSLQFSHNFWLQIFLLLTIIRNCHLWATSVSFFSFLFILHLHNSTIVA